MAERDAVQQTSEWRGGNSSRIEALTDTVFGFSIALLIVSVEVSADFSALLDTLKGFAGFALSFAMLILVWFYHYRYFERYRLGDGRIILLNSLLLFVVLFYIYPLKYLVYALTQMVVGHFPVSFEEAAILVAVYSAGFTAVFLIFAMMYQHAYRLRDRLGLDPFQALSARQQVADCLIMAAVGFLATLLAIALPTNWAAPTAGFSYFLIMPAQWLSSAYFERRKRHLSDPAEASLPGGES